MVRSGVRLETDRSRKVISKAGVAVQCSVAVESCSRIFSDGWYRYSGEKSVAAEKFQVQRHSSSVSP